MSSTRGSAGLCSSVAVAVTLGLSWTGTASAGVFKVGSFAKCTTNPCTTTTAHGLGVAPKALIFWTSSKTSNTLSGGYQYGFGVSDTTTSISLSGSAQDAVGTSNNGRRLALKALTVSNVGGTAATSEATLLSVDATNFSLQWTPNDTNASVIHYIAIGGSDVSAKVVNWTMATATGNRSVTGVGFKPDVVIHGHAGTAITAALPGSTTSAVFGMGVMDADGDQWAVSNNAVDASGTSDTQRSQTVSNCIYAVDNGLAIAKQANWVSMDNDGFTVNFNNTANANAAQMFSLALKGVNVKPGSFAKSTGAATATNTVTGIGFTPRVVMLASTFLAANDTPTANSRFGLGAGDGTTNAAAALQDTDNLNTSSNDGTDRTDLAFVKVDNNTPSTDAEATLGNFASGSFDVSWTKNDAVATQMLYLALGSLPATAIQLKSFDAQATGRETIVRWTTGYEVDNLGFRVYREEGGRRVPLDSGLVAGSALFTATSAELSNGRSYAIVDRQRIVPGTRYWIEELDLHGARIWHGPATATGGTSAGAVARSLALSAVATGATSRSIVPRTLGLAGGAPTAPAIGTWSGAGDPAVKIGVRESGWVRVPAAALFAAGLDTSTDPRTLQLYYHGTELPFVVSGEQDGQLDAGDAIEFYANERMAAESNESVYWLRAATGLGARIATVAPAAGGDARQSFWATLTRRDHLVYFPAIHGDGQGNFFGAVVADRAVDQTLTVPGVAAVGDSNAQLKVTLQGATDGAHDVALTVNGNPVDGLQFTGRTVFTATRSIPQSWLHEGDNVVQLTRRGGDTDVSLVESLQLGYWRKYEAVGDELEAAVDGPATLQLKGFAHGDVRVVELLGQQATQLVPAVATVQADGTYDVEVRVGPGAGHHLYAFGSGAVRAASRVVANRPSSWTSASNGADLLIVGPANLLAETALLKAAREQQGLVVDSIDVEDIYDELGYGEKSGQALRGLFQLAAGSWSKAPRYVLLVGDASFDPQNYLGLGSFDLVPTHLVDTASLQTASDDWFVDFNDDARPELAIGRLPARTPADVDVMVAKILGSGTSAESQPALLLADRGGEFDFQGPTQRLGEQLLGNFPQRMLLLNQLDAASATSQLTAGLRAGAWLVHYFGHGSVEQWAGGTLTSANASSLTDGSSSPLVVAMTCLNGYFHDVYTESLGEALLRAPNGGASAVWASSGFTSPTEQPALEREFLRLLAQDGATLGDAAKGAKLAVGDHDVQRTWILLGDPTQRRLDASLASSGEGRTVAVSSDSASSDSAASDSAGCSLTGGLAVNRSTWEAAAATLALVTFAVMLAARRKRQVARQDRRSRL